MCVFVKSIAERSLESQTTVTHRGLEAPGSGQRQVHLLSATDPRHLGTSVSVTVDPSCLPFPPWKWCRDFMESYFVRDAAQGEASGSEPGWPRFDGLRVCCATLEELLYLSEPLFLHCRMGMSLC